MHDYIPLLIKCRFIFGLLLEKTVFFTHAPLAGDIRVFVGGFERCVCEREKEVLIIPAWSPLTLRANAAAALRVQIASACRQPTGGVTTA